MKKPHFLFHKFLLICFFLLLIFTLSGCAKQNPSDPDNIRWAKVEDSQLIESRAGEKALYLINVDSKLIEEGVPLMIKVSGLVNTGSIQFELLCPDGKAVWNSGIIKPGDFSINNEYHFLPGQTGTYELGVVFGKSTSATYNLSWHTLKLKPIALLPGLGMILVAIGFVVISARSKTLIWNYLGLGALFWVLSVIAKSAFAVLVNPVILQALHTSRISLFSPGNLVAYLYIGALTGIFEVGLIWLILRKVRWGKANWRQALVFGIGFGVIEALVLGLTSVMYATIGMITPDALPLSTLSSLVNNATLVMGMAPIVERISLIFAHTLACVLIFYAIISNEAKWGWLSILYKTLLDIPGSFAAFWVVNNPGKTWSLELVIAIFGLVGLWGTIKIGRRYFRLSSSSENLL